MVCWSSKKFTGPSDDFRECFSHFNRLAPDDYNSAFHETNPFKCSSEQRVGDLPDCVGTREEQTSKSTDPILFSKRYTIPVTKSFSSLPSGTRAGPLNLLKIKGKSRRLLGKVIFFACGAESKKQARKNIAKGLADQIRRR